MELASAANPTSTTEPRRDAALDLLRAVALGRVLLWHAFAATWMTFFAAMPVMFFVAGTLFTAPTSVASYRALIRRRGRRLLLPLWVYGAVVAAAGLLRDQPRWESTLSSAPSALGHAFTWILPVVDPASSDWHGGWLSTHLWYLRAYLWILLLIPLLGALARRATRTLPVIGLAVVAVELCDRAHVPVVGSGTTGVLLGDLVTYGGFVVLGMAYRRHGRRLPVRPLAAGAAAAAVATAAYAVFAGIPAGGVNDSYGAAALTGVTWLLAAGAAEGPIRRLAERVSVRRLTSAVTRRAVTIYLWHPAAIVLAYAVLKGSARFPRMGVVQRWPVPAVSVVVLAVVSTLIAVAAVGWVEDLAARRSPPGRDRRGRREMRRVRSRAAGLAAVVPSLATTLALVVPSLVVPGVDPAAASVFSAPRPPSYRAALGNDAFAARRPVSGNAGPLDAVDLQKAQLDKALKRWLAGQKEVKSVAVGVALHGRFWTGTAHRKGAATHFKVDDEFGVLSMTKTFTTALVLFEVNAGRLSLDSPVPRIPGLRLTAEAAKITLRQLLEHTSGLGEYNVAPGYDITKPLDGKGAVQLAIDAGLISAPGAEVHYSNSNFQYLGLILEKVTGRPYGDLVADLFRAQGLHHSRLGPGSPGWPGYSSGGVISTLPDMIRWGDALFTPDRVLPAETVRQLTTLGDMNMGLSMWALCPCGTTPDGVKQYSAIGQTVGYGGLVHFPDGMTIVVRFDPVPPSIDAGLVSLGQELERTLRAAAAGRP